MARDAAEFTRGFAAAVATLIRAFDQPGMAIEIVRSNGLSLADFQRADVEDFDLLPIRKAWAAEVRVPGPAKRLHRRGGSHAH